MVVEDHVPPRRRHLRGDRTCRRRPSGALRQVPAQLRRTGMGKIAGLIWRSRARNWQGIHACHEDPSRSARRSSAQAARTTPRPRWTTPGNVWATPRWFRATPHARHHAPIRAVGILAVDLSWAQSNPSRSASKRRHPGSPPRRSRGDLGLCCSVLSRATGSPRCRAAAPGLPRPGGRRSRPRRRRTTQGRPPRRRPRSTPSRRS